MITYNTTSTEINPLLNMWFLILSKFCVIILYTNFFFFFGGGLWCCDPTQVMASSFLRFLDHTLWRITVSRTPLDEWSARRRDLYLTTHNTHTTNIRAPGGIRTHDLSRRAAADLRLRLRGYWDQLVYHTKEFKLCTIHHTVSGMFHTTMSKQQPHSKSI